MMLEIKKKNLTLKFKTVNSELSTVPKGLAGMQYPKIINSETHFYNYD